MNSPFLQNIEKIVLKNLENQELSIEFICKKAVLSRSQLHRKIKEESGLSTSLFVRKIKLNHGKQLLQETGMNISEIAYASGIDSPQNFSRYFVQEFGLSPSAFRKIESSKSDNEPILDAIQNGGTDITETIQNEVTRNKRHIIFLSSFGILSVISLVSLLMTMITSPKPERSIKLDYQTLKLEKGIAVLPFINIGLEDSTYMAEGLTEDIITQLSKIEDLPVISRTSSYKFQGSNMSISDIGKELKVPYILEGSIRIIGGKMKVSTNLINTNDDTRLWSKTFEKENNDYLDLQGEIALEIATTLQSKIGPDAIYRVREAPTQNVAAYNQLLIGKHLLRSREGGDLEESLKRFDEAISMDSSYADAYAYKAYALHLLGNLKYRDPIVSNKEAEYYALRALSFDRSNGQAYGVLGKIYANQYKWELAETSFKIALESSPGDAMLNYWYSLVKRTRGQIEEAIEYNERAKLLDPLYPVVHAGFIATCIYGKKYDLAWTHIEKDSTLFADNFVYHWVKAEYFSARKEYEKAVDHFQRGIKMNPQIKSLQTGRAYALAKLGDNAEAINIIQKQSTEIAAQIHTTAVLLAAMGNYEESLKNFIKAAEKGFIASDVLVDPTYAAVVENARYQSYLRKYNFID